MLHIMEHVLITKYIDDLQLLPKFLMEGKMYNMEISTKLMLIVKDSVQCKTGGRGEKICHLSLGTDIIVSTGFTLEAEIKC